MSSNAPTGSNGPPNPVSLLDAARKAVPAVDYALGAAGVAAAASIILFFIPGRGPAAAIIMGGVFLAMILLFSFASLVRSGGGSGAGTVLLWMVIGFFGVFLGFTITAFGFEWPKPWARALGILTDKLPETGDQTSWSLSNCSQEANWAVADFNQDPSNVAHVNSLINCKNPIGYNLKGESEFYAKKYSEAESDFENAIAQLPASSSNDVTLAGWQSNLASVYVETGKLNEAIDLYKKLVMKYPSNNEYRLGYGQALFYKGASEPSSYAAAIDILKGVDPTYLSGSPRNGRLQILLAATYAALSRVPGTPDSEKQSNLQLAISNLCDALSKNPRWSSVLSGDNNYIHASLTEEKQALLTITPTHCPA